MARAACRRWGDGCGGGGGGGGDGGPAGTSVRPPDGEGAPFPGTFVVPNAWEEQWGYETERRHKPNPHQISAANDRPGLLSTTPVGGGGHGLPAISGTPHPQDSAVGHKAVTNAHKNDLQIKQITFVIKNHYYDKQ